MSGPGFTRKQTLRMLGGTGLAVAGLSATRQRTIHRDVCIVGGGAAGTYAAVRLRDEGRSVAVVERAGRLGGHTESYHDPVTGGSTDLGVIVYHDRPVVRAFFDRFGLTLVPAGSFGGATTTYVDFRTGREVAYRPPAPVALPTYLGLLERYPYLDEGFELPDPVPAELLIPFGEFVRRYALDSVLPLIFGFGQGIGDLLAQPTLYVLKLVGLDAVRNILAGSFLITERHDNAEVYERATAFLGDDVLLDTHVREVERDGAGVRVRVGAPSGPRIIVAKRLLITFPPLLPAFAGFDLDRVERALFARFRPGYYATGVLRVSGLPEGRALDNVAPDTPYHLPPLPGLYSIYPSGIPGVSQLKYGALRPLPDATVIRNIRADIRRVAEAGTLPVRLERVELFKSHSPFELTVPVRDIAAGFYRHLSGLQGRNHTYYAGAAFHSHDSTLIWQYIERLLPRLTP